MIKYEKPILTVVDSIAEGVYMASGGSSNGCYTTSAYIHQTPQTGRGDYRIQVNGKHNADHTKESQILTIKFNMPVTYGWCNGSLMSGDGTDTLKIQLWYHQNPTDNIGLGDLVVSAESGLSIVSVSITD